MATDGTHHRPHDDNNHKDTTRSTSFSVIPSLSLDSSAGGAGAGVCSCTSWKPRGDRIIEGSRPYTQAGTSVAISNDGNVISFEEYGNQRAPYKQHGHGTGRLRVVSLDDSSSSSSSGKWIDAATFTEGLSTDMTMSADGTILSTIGYNISNDGFYSELDMIVQVYEQTTKQEPEETEQKNVKNSNVWIPRDNPFSKDNGLPFYPSNQCLSKDGSTLAISGPVNDEADMQDWESRYLVYHYVNADSMQTQEEQEHHHQQQAQTPPSTSSSSSKTKTKTPPLVRGSWQKMGQDDLILPGGLVDIALLNNGRTLATLAWTTDSSQFENNQVTARVFDFVPSTVGAPSTHTSTSTSITTATTSTRRTKTSHFDSSERILEGHWIPRGENITIPVILQRIPMFHVALSNDGNIMTIQAMENTTTSTTTSTTSASTSTSTTDTTTKDMSADDPGFLFPYEYVKNNKNENNVYGTASTHHNVEEGVWKLRGSKVTDIHKAFGYTFDMAGDGSVLAVGGYDFDEQNPNEDSDPIPYLHLFAYNGTGYQFQQRLTHVPAGSAVAISANGCYIVSSDASHRDFTGTVGVFECVTKQQEQQEQKE